MYCKRVEFLPETESEITPHVQEIVCVLFINIIKDILLLIYTDTDSLIVVFSEKNLC